MSQTDSASFWSRHSNKFLWLAGTFGTGYSLYKYAQHKWIEFEEKQRDDQLARAKYAISRSFSMIFL
jgi:hypothetical protein